MKLNPCKECGKQPTSYKTPNTHRLTCCASWVESKIEDRAPIGWNAMNPVEEQQPETVKEECGNCRFYDGRTCLRYPAQIVHTGSVTTEAWPTVYTHNWCGEWRSK